MTVAAGTAQWADNPDGTPASLTFPGLNVGDYLWVVGTVSTANAHSLTPSDDKGETYTELDSAVIDGSNFQEIRHWWTKIATAGTHVVTLTVGNEEPGQTFAGIMVIPVTGAAGTGGVTAHGPGNQQTSPGTGANAVTSGTAQTPAGTPALVLGFSQDVSNGDLAPGAGTGFTDGGTGFSGGARVESKRITSGNAQATFTLSSARSTLTQMAAFLEATVATSDVGESAARRQIRANAAYRMSPRSQREAQQVLKAQKQAYGFAGAA